MTMPSLSASVSAVGDLRTSGVAQRVVRRFTYPAEAPLSSITLYYAVLIGVGILVCVLVPSLRPAFGADRLASMVGEAAGLAGETTPVHGGAAFSLEFALLLAVAMIGSFLLMVPPSWVYMATARKKGFDQSVIQSMLLLGLSVAGVIMIVRNSVALAFSLAGIVGAVRYRNTLTEPRDTLFIFLAIGVGLAAGVGALPAAAALSIVFSYMVVVMARMDYGMCELGKSSAYLLHSPAAGSPADGGESGKRKKKPKDEFNAVLVVRANRAEAARGIVEPFLERETKRWRLAELESNPRNQRVHLKYVLRLGRKQDAGALEDALLAAGASHIVGARIH